SQVEAARGEEPGGLRRRRGAAAESAQGCRAAGAAGGRGRRLGRRAGGQARDARVRGMTALVWVEQEGGLVKDATLAAISAAGKLGAVHALVAGEPGEARAAAEAVAK